MKNFTILRALPFLLLAAAPATAQQPDPRNLVVMLRFSTALGETKQGAGIIIDQNERETLIVTAGHNLRDDEGLMHEDFTVEFRTAPGRPVRGEPIEEVISRTYDIGLVRVAAADALPILGTAVSASILDTGADGTADERVFVVGYGGGMPWSHALAPEPARRVSVAEIQVQSQGVLPGQSGGGVFNQDWALVGMIIDVQPPIARALPISLVLDEVRRTRYGVALEPSGDAARQLARRELAARNIAWTATTLADAIASVDTEVLGLFAEADAEPGLVLQAFARRTDSGTPVAQVFFERSRGNEAAMAWLRGALAGDLDPNATIEGANYPREGLLTSAIRAANAAAIVALVEGGASPHSYQELFLTPYEITRFLLPFNAILDHEGLTAEEKKNVLEAFVAAGGVLPSMDGIEQNATYQTAALADLYEKAPSLAGIRLAPTTPMTSSPRSPVCERASRRDGFDWCNFVETIPTHIHVGPGEQMYHDFWKMELLGLMNVVDGKAYLLGVERESYRPGFNVVEVSRDMRIWRVLRFMSPGAGMGLCREDTAGERRDDCWRRISMTYDPGQRRMMVEDYYPYTASREPPGG